MQVKIYFTEEGHIKIVDTTAIPSSGMVTEGRGWSGPTAAMASIDELDACDPYGRGVEIIRSAIRWNGDIVHASRVTLVSPEEARDVSEVYVDGTLVLVRSRADELVTVGRKQLDDEAIAEAVKIMGGDGDD